jgi:hypothetical protein
MKEDYLWDRSGEPDPEIEQLEEILGTLRYQPRPLVVPADLEIGGKRTFFRSLRPAMAIAAAIALLFLGAGLWFGLQRLKSNSSPVVLTPATPSSSPQAPDQSAPAPKQLPVNPDFRKPEIATLKQRPTKQGFLAKNKVRKESGNAAIENPQLATDRQEGEAARDQLFMALRLASAKLNFAQRKIHSSTSKEVIQNQHRIG